jgi:hypothetical protein
MKVQEGGSDDYPDIIFGVQNAVTTTPTERMRIKDTGQVGIGTNAPAELLEVEGTAAAIQIDSNGDSALRFATGGTVKHSIFSSSGVLNFFDNTNSATRMQITAAGDVLIGTTSTTVGGATSGSGFRVDGEDGILQAAASGNSPGIFNRTSSDGAILSFRKNGSEIGSIGVDNSDNLFISGNASHAGFEFGSSSIVPYKDGASLDDAIDLGGGSQRFDDIYATNGTIQTSDRNEKQDIENISEAETKVAVRAKSLLKKYRWKSAVKNKGDDARIHFGIIAQDLQDAFTAEGLDAGDYAMFISSTWWETQTEVSAVEAVEEVTDEEGNVTTEAVEAKDAYTRTDTFEILEEAPEGATERTRLGVRYSELLAFIITAI